MTVWCMGGLRIHPEEAGTGCTRPADVKRASDALKVILEYVGHVCFMAGTLKERKRVKQFIDWLLAQRAVKPLP